MDGGIDGLVPGRIVYVTGSDGVMRPAIVTHVHGETGVINASVFVDGGAVLWPASSVPYAESPTPGEASWHWMYAGQPTRGTSK